MKSVETRILETSGFLARAAVALCLIVACCAAMPSVALAADASNGQALTVQAADRSVKTVAFAYQHDPRDNPSAMADIVVNPDAIYGFSPSPKGSLKDYASGDWTDPKLVEAGREQRIAYHKSFGEMYDLLHQMEANGASTEQIARAVSDKRNELRLAAYKDDPEGLAMAKKRNLELYGNENGGTPDFFYKKYHGSWEKVIEKSFSVNSGMDACLGLYDDYYLVYVAAGQVPKLANTISAKPAKATQKLVYKTTERTLRASKLYKVTGAHGDVTYKKVVGNKGIKVAENGALTVKAGQPVGSYELTVRVTAAGDAVYEPGSANVSFAVKVAKAKNTLTVRNLPQTLKRCKLKKKARTIAPITVVKAKGALSFKVSEWTTPKAKKHFKLNTKTGKITVKKRTCKGTYRFKVKVSAQGTANYAKAAKEVTVKVRVK